MTATSTFTQLLNSDGKVSILCRLISAGRKTKLQALVYDILPLTTATIHYVKGLEKLSATGQFLFLLVLR